MSDSLPLIWIEAEAPPAAQAGRQLKLPFLLLHVGTKGISVAGWSRTNSWCHFCVSDGDGKGLASNHTLDYLEAGPAGVFLSAQRSSAPLQHEHQAVPRTSLERNYQPSVSQRGQKAAPLHFLSLLQQQQLAAAASPSLTAELHLIVPLSAAFSPSRAVLSADVR